METLMEFRPRTTLADCDPIPPALSPLLIKSSFFLENSY